ncbi:hypothetical protein [Microbacterium sp. USHLN272]|uniref:hypothetical protein n=1 Tax=Microbacterium sp. USHLN272 TaxID=3081287 RepID=UPI0030167F82
MMNERGRNLSGSIPAGTRRASLEMFWTTLQQTGSTATLLMWKFVPFRCLVLLAGGLLALEILAFLFLGMPMGALAIVLLVLAMLVAGFVVYALHTAWRLRDPHRLVLFAPDLGSSVDVIFKSRNRVSLANHGRAFGATSAPALRDSVAAWLNGLDGCHLDIRAQNRRVANHYIAQFPQLRISGRDWMGHYRLSATTPPPVSN